MKFTYDSEHDSLYIDLMGRAGSDAREVCPGVVLDLDHDGRVVGIDIDHASEVADLSRLEAESVPIQSSSRAE